MRRFWNKNPRRLRFFIDALLALILILSCLVALGCPPNGDLTRFRRAEKANLMGPSEILDCMDNPKDWLNARWVRLLIGDDGKEIVFWSYYRSAKSGIFLRVEKKDGVLLLPLPGCIYSMSLQLRGEMVMPLFLFVDDPAVVKATVQIQIPEYDVITLDQVRGEKACSGEENADSRERYFLFSIPMTQETWMMRRGIFARELLIGYRLIPFATVGYSATIWLYDNEDRLIETREWIL